jgi:hypothetical protein
MLTKRSIALVAVFAFAASQAAAQQQITSSAAATKDGSALLAAERACKHLKKAVNNALPPAPGISTYEACLGERANLTLPANPKLCALAKSIMSPGGICILGE